jgi:hypothetical protein
MGDAEVASRNRDSIGSAGCLGVSALNPLCVNLLNRYLVNTVKYVP